MPEVLHHGWLYRRTVLPLLALLRMGATPERLAWSIAVGLIIGLNPLLGTTTLLCLAIASIFRLNLAASQLANHVVYPLQLLLVVPLLRAGSRLFHTAPLPLSPAGLFDQARTHPLALTRQLWLWESHAVAVWALAATALLPLLASALTPVLRHFLDRQQSGNTHTRLD